VPRPRSARVATLGSPARRPALPGSPLKPRFGSPLRRRIVATALVVASLALLSVYFRESAGGPLHGVQSTGAAVLRPFQIAAERVARPFRDAANWFSGLADAKSDNAKLRRELDKYRQIVIQNQTAAAENDELKKLLRYQRSAQFPAGFTGIATRVISRAPTQFVQQVEIDAGSNQGIRVDAPVVTADGLVGHVTKVARSISQVTLLTDETSAASGLDPKTHATGIVRHDESTGELILDRVTKDQVVNLGDIVVTAGWRSEKLTDLYPKGIPIGAVASVGQVDTESYKLIQVEPFVHFSSLESVIVLAPIEEP
jgi:rod shape-determining protein MreC